MRTYEVLFILSTQLGEQDSTNLTKEFRAVAEKSGAKLLNEESWGRRRLAYPIEKVTEGVYHLFVFETEGEILSEMDRKMKNSDQVIRHIIVRTDLDHKRAAKLAARNPKKERRPAPSQVSSPMHAPAPVQAPSEPAAEMPAEVAPEAAPEAVATDNAAPAE